MAQEAEATPAEGQEPEATKEGQKPTAEPEKKEGETKTFDESYVKELRAENAKHRKEAQEAKAKAQEYEDAQKSELEKAQSKLQRAEQEKADSDAQLRRYEIATEKKVPPALVPLMTAKSREDLEAQADLILENATAQPTSMDGGVRESAPEPKTPNEAHRDFLMNVLGKPNDT